MLRFILVLIFSLCTNQALGADDIRYAPAESWVVRRDIPNANSALGDLAYQTLLSDQQHFFIEGGKKSYINIAFVIQNIDALPLGNVAINWQPEYETLTVHALEIIRDEKRLDAFKDGRKFTVLRREQNLELSVIDGRKTASLQLEGVSIGDIVNLAYTLERNEPMLDRNITLSLFGLASEHVENLHIRAIWPQGKKVSWKTSEGLPSPKLKKTELGHELSLSQQEVEPLLIETGAPTRFYLSPSLEIGSLSGWDKVSEQFAPLFDEAVELSENSELKKQAGVIKSKSDDPVRRMALALRLVQEQVRYVYEALNSGNYTPLNAEEAWRRRYGDCKAKAVLLVSLLREIGIEAEPALVSTTFADSLEDHLPSPELFDHVIVRAEIGGTNYWLDGTRVGDANLALSPLSLYRKALPLREKGATLLPINPPEMETPTSLVDIEIDASKGLEAPAKIKAKTVTYGDSAYIFNSQMNAFSKKMRDEQLTAIWSQMFSRAEIDKALAKYDAEKNILTLEMSGEIEIYKKGKEGDYKYRIPIISFSSPLILEAIEERQLPWTQILPFNYAYKTQLILPASSGEFEVLHEDYAETVAGLKVAKRAFVEGNKIILERSYVTTAPEISVSDAEILADAIDKFDHYVYFRERNAATVQDKDSDYYSSLVKAGNELALNGEYEKAFNTYSKAIEVNAKEAVAYNQRGFASLAMEDRGGAQRDFVKALSLEGEDDRAYRGLARLAEKNGDFESAEQYYSSAIEIREDWHRHWRNRAQARARLGKFNLALDDIEKSIKLNQSEASHYFYKAWLQVALEQYDAALETLRLAEKGKTNDFQFSEKASSLRDRIKQDSDELRDLNHWIKLDPEEAYSWNNRCWFRALRKARLEQALADCNKALELEPGDPASMDSRGYVHLQAGRYAEALDDFDRVLSGAGSFRVTSIYGRGVAKLKLGDASGDADIARARKEEPNTVERMESAGIVP